MPCSWVPSPPRRIVKVGDTPADMQEGVNAGMWTIGVTVSGNEIGLSEPDAAAMGIPRGTPA